MNRRALDDAHTSRFPLRKARGAVSPLLPSAHAVKAATPEQDRGSTEDIRTTESGRTGSQSGEPPQSL